MTMHRALAIVILMGVGLAQCTVAQDKTSKRELVEMKVVKFKHEVSDSHHTFTLFTETTTARYKLVCRDEHTNEKAKDQKAYPIMTLGDKFNAMKPAMKAANLVCVYFSDQAPDVAKWMNDNYGCYEIEEAEFK